MNGEYFALYANVFLVEGAVENILVDTHKHRYITIRKTISALIKNDLKKATMGEVLKKYPNWAKGVKAYTGYLIEEDFAFLTKEPHKFPEMDLAYKRPYDLDTAIVVVNFGSTIDYPSFMEAVLNVNIQNLLLIFKSVPELCFEAIDALISGFKQSSLVAIQLYFERPELNGEALEKLTSDLRVSVKEFGSPATAILEDDPDRDGLVGRPTIRKTSQVLQLEALQEYGPEHMNLSLSHFIEAQKHVTGLNAKFCIDANGNIKNELRHPTIFGNVSSDSIVEVVASANFQTKWQVANDLVEKCKDCQFRYSCYSNSDLKKVGNQWYKVEACTFNPYKNQWERVE
ncbi:MAG: hypothetical protein ACFB10_15905 [Salibacteraceae bacterium]